MPTGTSDLIEKHYDELSHLGNPRTPIRVAILEELNSNGSLRKSELEKIFVRGDGDGRWDFDVSKPTLHRQFEERTGENVNGSLVENGWVKDVSESRGAEARYEITPKGQMLCEEIRSLFDLLSFLDEIPSDLEPFLDVIMEADLEVSKEVLRELADSDIYTKSPTGLDRTTTKGLQFVSRSSYHRGISWVSSEDYVDYYHMFLKDQNNEAEFVFTSEVLEGLVENHTEKWGEILETGNISLFEHDVFPLGLTIVEQGVAWGYFEPPHGTHKAELITESETVREWAIGVFEECKQEGRNVTEEQLEKTKEV